MHVPTRLEVIRGYPAPGLYEKEVFEFPLAPSDHEFFYTNSVGFQYQAEAVRKAILEGIWKADRCRGAGVHIIGGCWLVVLRGAEKTMFFLLFYFSADMESKERKAPLLTFFFCLLAAQ